MVMALPSLACHCLPDAAMSTSNASFTSCPVSTSAIPRTLRCSTETSCPVSTSAIPRTLRCSTEARYSGGQVTRSSTPPTEDQVGRRSFSHSFLLLVSSLVVQSFAQEDALAFSFGISGPKEWLRGQKKKTADFLLAPILASRERLKEAVSMTEANSNAEALKLVKVAARDCIKPDEGSIIAFQTKTGVEVCTFRLILKNAASLLDDTDPVKMNASIALDNLISSFTNLNNSLSDGSAEGRDAIPYAFSQANAALDNFESGIRECLGIA